jgi:hypothetical protein
MIHTITVPIKFISQLRVYKIIMAEVMRERCHAITTRRGLNRRCKHTTLRGIYCWQHLKAIEHLRIKKSILFPDAGMGLFTTVPIKKDVKITPYTGPVVVSHDPNYGNPYVLQIKKHPPTFIDSIKTNEPGLGRWANAARGKKQDNAQLIYNKRKAYLKSIKPISANAEITTSYGSTYWKHYKKKAKAVVPKRRRVVR